MKHSLLFLGTGAADTSPRIAAEFPDCFRLDERRCSSVLLDRRILIDCGPHTLDALRIAGEDPAGITDLVLTHLHRDHYRPDAIARLAALTGMPLRIHFRAGAPVAVPEGALACPTELFREVPVGALRMTGFPANHDAFPMHLSFTDGETSFLYASDGAWFLGETVRAMRGLGYRAVFLDATVGDYTGDYRMGEHNSIPMLRLMVPSMRTLGILNGTSEVWLTHIAPTLHKGHDNLTEIARREGWQVAYDGLEIEI